VSGLCMIAQVANITATAKSSSGMSMISLFPPVRDRP
jgi:hypothetical protein